MKTSARPRVPFFVLLLVPMALLPIGDRARASEALRHERFRLDNGLEVILHEDHTLPLVAVDLWFHVGAADERAGRSGFAHLFEHLMFMGTERVPGNEFDRILEAGGAWSNASTDHDRTDYYEVGPSHMLPRMLWLEADRMEGLGAAMTQEKLDLQRDVVRNERRESYDDAPYGTADLMLAGMLFPPGHPYHDPIIGSHEDLEKATVADVQAFFATWYVPNNATLVVVGDFETGPTRERIRTLFERIPARALPVRSAPAPVEFARPVQRNVVDDVQAPRVTYAWHSPAFYAPGDAAMDILASVLADGRNSRLQRRLQEEEALATEVWAWQESRRWGSIFQIQVTAAEGVSLERVEQVIDEELRTFVAEGPKAQEMERLLASLEAETLEDLQGLLSVSDRLSHYDAYLGAADRLDWDLARYRALTPEGVRAWAERVLAPNKRVTLRVTPAGETEAPAASFPEQPPVGAEPAFAPSTPSVFHLENGLEVWHVERPELPLLSARLVLPAGSRRDAPDAAGAARMTAKMLMEGAGELDAAAFAARLEQMGARLTAYADADATVLNLFAAERHAEATFALLASAVRTPRFETAAWARVRDRHVDRLGQRVDDAGDLARRAVRGTYFGWDSGYGRPPDATPQRVAALELAACRSFFDAAYGPRGTRLLLAGSLDVAAARALVERHLGAWSGPAAPPPAPPAPARTDDLRVVLVDRPGATQTVLRLALPGVPYGAPDRPELDVLNALLGGNFISRLNANLREEHGYTYGAWSEFECWDGDGVLGAGAAVETDVTGAALAEMLGELRRIRTGDITEEEARSARASLRVAAVTSFQQLSGVLDAYEPYARTGQAPEALGAARAAVERATVTRLNELAKRHVHPDRGVIVLVGDRARILPQLESLGLPGPLVTESEAVLEGMVRTEAPARGGN